MGFFDADLPPVPEAADGQPLYAPDAGARYGDHARDYVVPAVLPWGRRLGVGPDTQVWLRRVDVWPDGFTLELGVFRRIARLDRSPVAMMRGDLAALRLGLVMADGTRATSVGRGFALPTPPGLQGPGPYSDEDFCEGAGATVGDDEPLGPYGDGAGTPTPDSLGIALMPRGGSMHYSTYCAQVPVLPPEGPVTVVVEWPAEQVPETQTELDGTAIRGAADDAVEVWPDLPPRPDSGHPASYGHGYGGAFVHGLVGGAASPVPPMPPPPQGPEPYPPPRHAPPARWVPYGLPYGPMAYGSAPYGPPPYGPPPYGPPPDAPPGEKPESEGPDEPNGPRDGVG